MLTTLNDDGQHFRANIRTYNNLFAFTSMDIKLDTKVATKQKGIYTFRAQRQIYHYINSLQSPNTTSKYLQFYFFDTDHELQHHCQISL
ncbi:hypothetical protein ACSBR1_040276 [Camellia fascicularis]